MRGLQIGIGFVLREPLPVLGQRRGLRSYSPRTPAVRRRGVFVLVITKVHNKIGWSSASLR